MFIMPKCPRCGAMVFEDQQLLCSHCGCIFKWVRVNIPVEKDLNMIEIRAKKGFACSRP